MYTVLTGFFCVFIFVTCYSDECELTNLIYAKHENCTGLNETDFSISTLDNVTPVDCIKACEGTFRCRMFFYNKNTHSCSLHYRTFGHISATPESDTQCYISEDFDESWVVNIIDKSSYKYPKRPEAIRYEPNALSWTGLTQIDEFVEFQIDTKMYVEEMIIYERGYAGGVLNISVMDPDGDWQTVWVTEGLVKIEGGRNMTHELTMTDFKTDTLRMDIGYRDRKAQIDAVKVFGKLHRRTLFS